MEANKIICGDCLTELKKLPAESINCCMTSPPYWALRDYQTEGMIWDAKEECEHDFEIKEIKNPMDRGGKGQHDIGGMVGKMGENTKTTYHSGFCSKCLAWKGSLGLEPTFDLYIKHLCDIFDEIKRVLRKDGTCWVNIGDTYGTKSGSGFANDNLNPQTPEEISKGTGIYEANKLRGTSPEMHKNLCNIPARFSIEMQNRGWILRNVIIWHKPNCMPSSVKDRFTVDFEYLFFFVKNKKYFFETQYEPSIWASKDKRSLLGRVEHKSGKTKLDEFQGGMNGVGYNPLGKNKRAVWTITTKPFKESHFATYPEALCETPIKAGCPEFICNKCGMAREKVFKYNNLKEEGHGKLIIKEEPYAVQHREGEILVRDLPEEKLILAYLRKWKNISMTELSEKMNLPLTSCSHWFSDLNSTHGFSYPTKEQWIKLKEIFGFDDTFDISMTKEYYKPAGVMDNEYKEIGYSDCGCNAGFSGGIVLDPFFGAGTTGLVALKQNKQFIGIELNPKYIEIAMNRIKPYLEQKKLIPLNDNKEQKHL